MKTIEEAVDKAKAVRKKRHPLQLTYTEFDPDPATLEANGLVSFTCSDPSYSCFDILRTRLLQTMRAHDWRSVAITSPNASAGKSFVALNLAASIARLESEKPLLVDLDLRNPSISRYLGVPPNISLTHYLNGDLGFYNTIAKIKDSHLGILPNHQPFPDPGETIASKKVSDMVQQLYKCDDWSPLIFDLPPVLAADDVIAFMPNVDCILVVVAADSSKAGELGECLNLLSPFEIIGTVLNKYDSNKPYYY